MHIITDLHIHSKYSRATSKHLTLPHIAYWAKKKGTHLAVTGDWNHPLWMREIDEQLEEIGNGFLKIKNSKSNPPAGGQQSSITDVQFMLATEISCIYSQDGKGRRIHILVWVPSLESAKKINQEMTRQGCNLMSDGRPIIGLSAIQLTELILTIEPRALVIPAHVWTPWFSLYGAMSGFDSIEEAFGSYAKHIYAVETGLSSSPDMNWRIQDLDTRAIVSFSDAHSGAKFGREATVFSFKGKNVSEFSFDALYEGIQARYIGNKNPKSHIAYTIEFYPEEGKYHYTGHRKCDIRLDLPETRKKGLTCEVCGKPLTQGVMQRVEELAGRDEEELALSVVDQKLIDDGPKVKMTKSQAFPHRPPFVMIVPLQEIIAESLSKGFNTKTVVSEYDRMVSKFGGEFEILLSTHLDELQQDVDSRIIEAIEKVRNRDIVVDPGYDGVFGVVKIWKDEKDKPLVDKRREQLGMFEGKFQNNSE